MPKSKITPLSDTASADGAIPPSSIIKTQAGDQGITPAPDSDSTGTQTRKKGRPAKGEPVMVRLSEAERIVAEDLGDGVVAQGIRIALNAAAQIGKTSALLLSKQGKKD